MGDVVGLWNYDELSKIFSSCIKTQGDALGISIDTRTIKEGDIFFAINGENSDGHDYISQALFEGVSFAVVSKDVCISSNKIIFVKDVMQSLRDMAIFARKRNCGRIISVTGSCGKTTTKEMLKTVLSEFGKTHANVSNYNNHFGVPISLARMPRDAEFSVFEVGSSGIGEIKPLAKMVDSQISIITNISTAHIGNFPSYEHIFAEKVSIMTPNSVCVINDCCINEYVISKAKLNNVKIVSFGKNENSDCRLIHYNNSSITASIFGNILRYKLKVFGEHMALNSVAVLSVAHLLGLNIDIASKQLENFSAVKGRGKSFVSKISSGLVTILDESYNANPLSMSCAINLLKEFPGKRKIAVLGDMFELGDFSKNMHLSIKEELLKNSINLIFLCGENMKILHNEIESVHTNSSEELIPELTKILQDGDVVMIKGSLSMKMGKIVDHFLQFSD